MATIKDVFNLPLPQLRDALKGYLDVSFDYWVKKLGQEEKCCEGSCQKEKEKEREKEESKVPADLKAVIHTNKAIAEKYQATGADSLLNILSEKLAYDRGVEKEEVMDEIKEYLKVDPDQQALMAILPAERPQYVAKKVLSENEELVEKMKDGDKEAFIAIREIAIKQSFKVVPERDVVLALRVKARDLLNKAKEDEK